MHRWSAFALLFGALTVGCGGTAEQTRVSSPFTDVHAEVFENGLDFVSDPTTLEGRWLQEWQRELDVRVADSDLIARVEVDQLRTAWDLDRHIYQMELRVVEPLYGRAPSAPVVATSVQGELGFASVKSSESRLLHTTYVLFVKWAEVEPGRIVARWHLSPDAELVVATVRERLRLSGRSAPAAR